MSKDKDKKPKHKPAPVADAGGPPPPPAPAPAAVPPPPVDRGRVSFGLTRFANLLGGARLCYGDPVQVGDRVVIPVARVRGAGGYGFGRGSSRADDGTDTGDGDGGGAGGALEATPAGFLDITADGVRYEAIPDPVTTARALSTGASALTMLLSAVVGLRRLQRGRRTRGLLPRSR